MCLLQLQKQVKGFRLKCPKLPSALIWSTTQIISAQKWCYGGTFPLMDGVKVNFVEVYSISNGWRVKKKNKQHKPAQQLWCTLAYMIQVSGIVLNRWTLFFQKKYSLHWCLDSGGGVGLLCCSKISQRCLLGLGYSDCEGPVIYIIFLLFKPFSGLSCRVGRGGVIL